MMTTSVYSWHYSTNFAEIPTEPVPAGRDTHGDEVFVARIQHENNQIAVSVTPNQRLLIGFHEQQPVVSESFEYLTGNDFFWSESVPNGQLPESAVPVGITADGSYRFIGRVTLDNGLTLVGSICPQLQRILLDDEPTTHNTYQVLCHPSERKRQSVTRIPQCEARTHHYQWVTVKGQDPIPPNALLGGFDSDRRNLYIARFWHEGDVIPGKIIGSSADVSLVDYISGPYKKQEINVHHCQILTGTDFRWQACENGEVPFGAVQTGEANNGEALFVGRGRVMNSLTPGKVVQSKQCLVIGHSWRAFRVDAYEILIHGQEDNINYEWKSCDDLTQLPEDVVKAGLEVFVGSIVIDEVRHLVSCNIETFLKPNNFQALTGKCFLWSKKFEHGKIPKDAVPCGRNRNGEMCFIGRKKYENEIIVGEISPIKRCMFVTLPSEIVSVTDYEVLTHPKEWGKQALSCIPLEPNMLQTSMWIDVKQHDPLPENAVIAGWNDTEDESLYIGRFWNAGEVLPATIFVDDNLQISKVTATQNNKEISATCFQVLTGSGLSWQPCQRGQLPSDAIETGKSLDGEPLLIGRAMHYHSLIPGKVQPSHGCMYLAWNRQVIDKREFEVLVVLTENENSFQWMSSSIHQPLPEKTVFVGLDTDGSEIYAGRLMHDNMMLPANIIPKRRLALGSIDGIEVESRNYQILVGTGFAWIDCINGQVPTNAIKLLTNDGQEGIFLGRVQADKCLRLGRVSASQRCLFVPHEGDEHRYSHYQALVKLTKDEQFVDEGYRWVAIDGALKSDVLTNVVPCKESAGTSYVGRLFHEGEFLPAEVTTNFKMAVAVFKNSVITSTKFEVLTGTSFSWEQSSDGGIPSGAIVSGKTIYGEWLFIGRVKDEKHIRIGKVHPSHGRIYVPHNSKTKTYGSYEVLVQHKPMSHAVPMVEGETIEKCCVCWENEATMAVIPCGNLCLCCECSQNPMLDRCPVCRGPKLHCIRIFKT